MKTKSMFGPIILIALGIIFLLSNFDLLPRLWPLIAQWWPLALIVAGVYMLVQRSRESPPR